MYQYQDSVTLAKRVFAHIQNKTTDMASEVLELPASNYTSQERYEAEVDRVFRHLPIPLAMSVELPEPRTYVAMTVVGVPVIAMRGEDGVVRAFVNSCRHRGAQLCEPGHGKARHLLCPYHAWRYDMQGQLRGVYAPETFGEFKLAENSLVELPCVEASGIIWVSLTPGETFDIDEWLGDFKQQLDTVNLAGWHFYRQIEFSGPSWKTTWDGFQDIYHHEVLHPQTVGVFTIGNLLVHDVYGPHQRMVYGRSSLRQLKEVPENDSEAEAQIRRVHLVFPNMAVSGIFGGYCMINQVFPGPTQETTVTRQTVLVSKLPETDDEIKALEDFCQMVLTAIRDEDYPVNQRLHEALKSGRRQEVMFGRNEPAGQHFHKTLAGFMGNSFPMDAR